MIGTRPGHRSAPGSVRFLLLLLAAFAGEAPAVSDGAPQSRAQLCVASARSCGLGEMTAILDDGPVAIWWNPGMLAFDRTVRFTGTRSELAKGLADDIVLSTYQIQGGSLAIGPLQVRAALGHTYLSLGSSDIITEGGERVGTFHGWDKLYNLVFSGSYRDALAVGVAYEYTYSRLSPPIPEIGLDYPSVGRANSFSFGLGFRPEFCVLPVDVETPPDAKRTESGLYLSPLLAASVLHLGEGIRYRPDVESEDLPRQVHVGGGLRAAFRPGTKGDLFDLRRLLTWEVLFGYEYDQSLLGPMNIIRHYGLEAKVGGIFSCRYGKIIDKAGGIEGTTKGFGFGIEGLFPVGARLDWASIPQSFFFPRLERWEISLFYDPTILRCAAP